MDAHNTKLEEAIKSFVVDMLAVPNHEMAYFVHGFKASRDMTQTDHAAAVAELIEANKLLLDSTSNKMCFRNEKEREAYRRIQNALARVGGAA